MSTKVFFPDEIKITDLTIGDMLITIDGRIRIFIGESDHLPERPLAFFLTPKGTFVVDALSMEISRGGDHNVLWGGYRLIKASEQ